MIREKEQVYVVNQPKHITTTIVVVNTESFPLSPETHDKIHALNEFSDVFLIFSANKFQAQKTIDYDKFASLYEVCAWINSAENIGRTLLKALLYDKEIFGNHSNYVILNIQDLPGIDVDKVTRLIPSTIAAPVFKIRRLSTDEYGKIYTVPEPKPRKSRFCKLYGMVENIVDHKTKEKFNNDRKFCSYTVSSDLMFFRGPSIDVILDILLSHQKERSEAFINSFSGELDVRYFIGSLIKFLGMDNFNYDYLEVEV